jgi:asparagine synthase (glutamine-hydrolysing)
MCGIIAYFGKEQPTDITYLDHRGPDEQVCKKLGKCTMCFSRLCINDVSANGSQPFINNGKMLVCNGEIYNWKEFETGDEISKSDCEPLIDLIDRIGIKNACNIIRGVFAFIWTDGNRIIAARDPIGVRPLFYTKDKEGMVFASEVKGLGKDAKAEIFPPGYFYDSFCDNFICYYPIYWSCTYFPGIQTDLKRNLEAAVMKRIDNTDRPIGFFLSGGLDSSLIVSIAKKQLPKNTIIKTFSIGVGDSPDIKAAKIVADYLNTQHHEIIFHFDEGINVLDDVIKSLESYDTTTIRASTPMWILSRWIKQNTDCRVLLSGEGSDELLGGYKYFQNAPSAELFNLETHRRIANLHQYDVLRTDRCTAAHGLEVRVPFLDRDFIDSVMEQEPETKMTVEEKKILRDVFDDNYLPNEILHRKKDAFSDAVGYSWVGYIKNYAEKQISDEEFELIKNKSQDHNIPTTKEEALYRKIFWKHYGSKNDHLISEIWRPKWTNITDPSARLI